MNYNCGQCGRVGWNPARAGGKRICFDCGGTVIPGKPMAGDLAPFWLPRKPDQTFVETPAG